MLRPLREGCLKGAGQPEHVVVVPGPDNACLLESGIVNRSSPAREAVCEAAFFRLRSVRI